MEAEADENNKDGKDGKITSKSSVSTQGFEGKPDFPKIEIQVPDDRREMET